MDTARPKVIKRDNVAIHSDLRRLVRSMRKALIRRYPDATERNEAAMEIMREVLGAA